MMRVFGAYRVGHAADGSPLRPPARLLQAATATTTATARQPSDGHAT